MQNGVDGGIEPVGDGKERISGNDRIDKSGASGRRRCGDADLLAGNDEVWVDTGIGLDNGLDGGVKTDGDTG